MLLTPRLPPKLDALFPRLGATVVELAEAVDPIDDLRRRVLDGLAAVIAEGEPGGTDLLLVCTHNSRRSHVAMIWAVVAAHLYGFERVNTYSGGTAVTAFDPRAIAALSRAGFEVHIPRGDNPRVLVDYGPGLATPPCYSKPFDDPANPQSDYVAVMTCADADANCPYLPAARRRVPLRYRDPGHADDSEGEAAAYAGLVRQVGRELLFVFAKARGLIGTQ